MGTRDPAPTEHRAVTAQYQQQIGVSQRILRCGEIRQIARGSHIIREQWTRATFEDKGNKLARQVGGPRLDRVRSDADRSDGFVIAVHITSVGLRWFLRQSVEDFASRLRCSGLSPGPFAYALGFFVVFGFWVFSISSNSAPRLLYTAG